MSSKITDILNKLHTINNNLNRKMQPIYDYAKSLSLKDTELSTNEKLKSLQTTLEKYVEVKNNPYLNTTNDKEKEENQIYFIQLLERLNRNNLTKNNHYRYIIDLYERRKDMSKYLKKIRNDKDTFINLSKKYNLSASTEMEELINFTTVIGERQIIPLLYMFEKDDDEMNNRDLKSLFSILFFGTKMQYTFYKNIDSLEIKLENARYDFFEKLQTDTYL